MRRPVHVLYVDDDAPLRDLTAELLEKVSSDITVHTAADPTTVPTKVDAGTVDCVVSDYEMPEQNGLELCWEVRSAHPDLPFFLFTSRGGEEIVSRAMLAGATDYIQKEPGVEQYTLLANRITNAVARHRLEKRLAELEQVVGDRAADDAVEVVGETDLDLEIDAVRGVEH
jgi:DNA-binding NtrC family response regulator